MDKHIQNQHKNKKKRVNKKFHRKHIGKGLVNWIIDKIPVELHVPKYQYCGPGTHLEKRLARGDQGINPLDAACKQHDIAYDKYKQDMERSEADKILQKKALERVMAKDASIGERVTALGVAAAMKTKRVFSGKGNKTHKKKKKIIGKGLSSGKKKTEKMSFSSLIKESKTAIKKKKPDNIVSAIKVAVASIRKSKRGKKVNAPRTIQLPASTVTGGLLPLVPIFAGLGALGSIVGSTAGIFNAMNQAKNAQTELEESKRHNKTMEAIAIDATNKSGRGFFLHPPRKDGKGFYLSSKNYHAAKNR